MKDSIQIKTKGGNLVNADLKKVHTLIIGSGAAGLNAAVQLHNQGIEDIVIVSEGLQKGTSINTGSDKQTYYKIGMCSRDNDSPEALAETFFNGGSMHGDLALVEASLSARGFINLVNLGVQFPRDQYGQFVGYKTDHDPLKRATSFGPYTSREMCKVLIKEAERRQIKVMEDRVVVSLLTQQDGKEKRASGAIAIHRKGEESSCFEVYQAENIVFATGGPGGIYKTSVYPAVHTGGIGLALLAGAKAQSLPESQYGLASVKFRWNVSGTYMQVIPKFISLNKDGTGEATEFLRPYFKSVGEMNSYIFLKGYQWPFDPRKVVNGSSLVDILVYIETVIKGRRVYMDFRENCKGFDFKGLSDEAYNYLEKSGALSGTPIERLEKMNQPAIELYKDHNIDIKTEALEIAVCAQHNNGGLAGNLWWESTNISHLFPVGEVNGSHGVYRPGGSALNSGQVASYRAAEYIANVYKKRNLDESEFLNIAEDELSSLLNWVEAGKESSLKWKDVRDEFQERMSRAGAHIRSSELLKQAIKEAWQQWENYNESACSYQHVRELSEVLRNRQLMYAHIVYLEALKFTLDSGVGSRGSSLVLDESGEKAHSDLGDEWYFKPEDESFREKVLETIAKAGKVENNWVDRRPLPQTDPWFEEVWANYREGKIYE